MLWDEVTVGGCEASEQEDRRATAQRGRRHLAVQRDGGSGGGEGRGNQVSDQVVAQKLLLSCFSAK